jgi:hypothetical protein
MFGLEKFLGGLVLVVATLVGLFISANAHDSGFAFFGYLLFLFGVLMLFRYIALVTGKGETQP